MKELSNEEKIKRYNELSKGVRDFFEGKQKMCGDVTKALENLFPELVESEDEKIRKALINFFNIKPGLTYGFDNKDIIDWLERQRETAFSEVSNNKKYVLTNETICAYDRILYRIKALKNFGDVKAGDLGGWIESENNLSQEGNCWVYGNAIVCDCARICDNAKVRGELILVVVSGNANITKNAEIIRNNDYSVYRDTWSNTSWYNRYITWTRSNGKWTIGRFYGTDKELIKEAYKDSKKSGKRYEAIVDVNKLLSSN